MGAGAGTSGCGVAAAPGPVGRRWSGGGAAGELGDEGDDESPDGPNYPAPTAATGQTLCWEIVLDSTGEPEAVEIDCTIGATESLSLIIRAGAGTNNIDKQAASARGVYVANCPGMNSIAVK